MYFPHNSWLKLVIRMDPWNIISQCKKPTSGLSKASSLEAKEGYNTLLTQHCSKTSHQCSVPLRRDRKHPWGGTFQAPREESGSSRTESPQMSWHYQTPSPDIKDAEVAKTRGAEQQEP